MVSAGIGVEEIEASLDAKSKKVSRRKGDAKPDFAAQQKAAETKAAPAAPAAAVLKDADAPIKIQSYRYEDLSAAQRKELLKRPALRTEQVMEICRPILRSVKERGDAALLELTEKFDKAKLTTPVRLPPLSTTRSWPRSNPRSRLPSTLPTTTSTSSTRRKRRRLATRRPSRRAPTVRGWAGGTGGWSVGGGDDARSGVQEVCEADRVCRVVRARWIGGVAFDGADAGLYPRRWRGVPPSSLLHRLGRMEASRPRCSTARPRSTPLRSLCAGGAQAVAGMAYGTESCPKVDKIVGPGNQFVTAAKMLVQNETDAIVSIDMPAGPSEVLVIADGEADPAFVASDLLSQAEHGPDSQVVLVGIALTPSQLAAIESEVDKQARALPRVDVVRQAIDKSVTIIVPDRSAAMEWSNAYAPEHLILQTANPEELVNSVQNAGSVFVGQWSPESCGDYMSGTNHSLPTAAYAKSYSGVNVGTFEKCITSQSLTREGLKGFGQNVVDLALCEGLQAHAMAVKIRLDRLTALTIVYSIRIDVSQINQKHAQRPRQHQSDGTFA